MKKKKKQNYIKPKLFVKIRKNIITGIITILPLFVTYLFIAWLMKLLHKNLEFIPKLLTPNNELLIYLFEVLLLLIILLFIYLVGVMTNKYIGKKSIKMGENLLNKIPLIRTIYTGTKQILDGLMVNNKRAFKKVVLVEYPRKGMQCIGFITGEVEIIKNHRKQKLYTVFIPSTPAPTTGFMVILPRKDVIMLDISPDKALKSIISGGVITPKLKINE